MYAVKPRSYLLRHDETGTVKVLLAAGTDVNLQEKVNKPDALCVDNFACFVDCLSMLTIMHFFFWF